MIAIIFILVTITYFLLNIIYVLCRNYKAHKFFQAKSSRLPILPSPSLFHGHFLRVTWPPKNWLIISKLHEKYGNSFAFYMCDQPWVSTKDLDLLKLIEVDKAHKHINRSKFGLPFKEFNDSIFQVFDDDWRRIRRAISPALTNHKVRSEEVSSDIKSILDQLAHGLKEKAKRGAFVLDVHDTFRRYTLAVIFLITYKRNNVISFNLDERDDWVEVMEKGSRNISSPIVALAMMFPFIRPICSFLSHYHESGILQDKIIEYVIKATDLNRSAREAHSKHQKRLSVTVDNYKERKFEDLKRQGNFKRRLVDTIIDAYMDKKITYDDFIGSTLFLLLAGFETTADTITCLIWHLAQNSEIQEKLRKTIMEEGIEADYVGWCIQETVRWHPAVPLGTGRILSEDVEVNGILYPKGSFVMPSTHSIHHDSSIWPEADKFKPERWARSSEFHPAAFMGFGLGPRNCVGGKLAVYEIKLVMQMLLTQFKIEKCSETCTEYNFSAPGLIYTILDEPIKVRFVSLP